MTASPFERDSLHVSHSQVNTYLLCPEKFRLSYVKGIAPSFRSSELVFGSAIHAALAKYHTLLMHDAQKPPLEVLTTEFDEFMEVAKAGPIPILWKDDDDEATLKTQGHALMTQYLERTPDRVHAVEAPFSLSLGPNIEENLVGVIDVIEEDADGNFFLTELKTASRAFDASRLQFDRQMSVYAAAKEALGIPDATLRFRVLLKTKKPSIVEHRVHRDESHMREAFFVTSQVLKAIDNALFYPLRGWVCQSCPYRSSCGS